MRQHEKQAIEELARLLDGELRPDDASARVRELASLATAVQDEIDVVAPTPAFKAALRTELLDGLAIVEVSLLDRVRDAVWERTARWRHSAKLMVASATASSLLGTAGVAVAAQEALPGEFLYPVKQITEDVRMGFARGLQETGRLHLTFATERLEELTLGIDGYDADTVIDLLGDMDHETLAGTEDLLRAYQETGNDLILVVLERFAEQQRDGLSALYDRLPSEAVPFVDRSFEILRRIEVTVAAINHGCESCASASGTDGLLGVNAPGEGPAIDDGCDCLSLLPSGVDGDGTGTGLGDALGDGSGDGDADGSGDGDLGNDLTTGVPDLPSPLDGVSKGLEDAIGGLGDSDSTVSDPIDGTTDTTTGTVDDAVEDTTETVDDTTDSTTGTLEDTTGDVTGDTTDSGTTDTDDAVEDTTGTVDELLDDATEDDTLLP